MEAGWESEESFSGWRGLGSSRGRSESRSGGERHEHRCRRDLFDRVGALGDDAKLCDLAADRLVEWVVLFVEASGDGSFQEVTQNDESGFFDVLGLAFLREAGLGPLELGQGADVADGGEGEPDEDAATEDADDGAEASEVLLLALLDLGGFNEDAEDGAGSEDDSETEDEADGAGHPGVGIGDDEAGDRVATLESPVGREGPRTDGNEGDEHSGQSLTKPAAAKPRMMIALPAPMIMLGRSMPSMGSGWLRSLLGEAALGALAEKVVAEDESGHGFHDGDGAREDAGVVAAAAFEFGILMVGADRGLGGHDRGGGFEGHAEDDGFTVADASLDAAGAVRVSADLVAFHVEVIVVFHAGEAGAFEAASDLESFCGGRLIMALASSASSLSKTGSPRPAGQPRTTASTTPPRELPSPRAALMRSIIGSTAAGSPVRTMLDSMVSPVTVSGSTVASRFWIRLTQARISMPGARWSRTLRATAAAATRPMVSRLRNDRHPANCEGRILRRRCSRRERGGI